jgi:hypothetical protein
MNRSYGSEGIALIECINPRLNKYRVRWDIQPYFNANGENMGVSFVEKEFLYKPTIAEVKDTILGWINEQTDNRIISGFVWQDMAVWLSSENQFNYKAAYDLAFQTNGASLPTVFKFGTTEEPIYHKFDTVEELSDFYIKAMKYINEQLAIGWYAKDNFDWSEYERILN